MNPKVQKSPTRFGQMGAVDRQCEAWEERDHRATAYHESGHAVQMLVEGGDVDYISLRPRSARTRLSVPWPGVARPVVLVDAHGSGGTVSMPYAQTSPTVSLAGLAAEIEFLAREYGESAAWDEAWAFDWAKAGDLLERQGRDADECPSLVATVRGGLRRHWAAVGGLAAALLDKGFLSGHEVRAIVTEHLDEATRRKLHDPFEDGWRGG